MLSRVENGEADDDKRSQRELAVHMTGHRARGEGEDDPAFEKEHQQGHVDDDRPGIGVGDRAGLRRPAWLSTFL